MHHTVDEVDPFRSFNRQLDGCSTEYGKLCQARPRAPSAPASTWAGKPTNREGNWQRDVKRGCGIAPCLEAELVTSRRPVPFTATALAQHGRIAPLQRDSLPGWRTRLEPVVWQQTDTERSRWDRKAFRSMPVAGLRSARLDDLAIPTEIDRRGNENRPAHFKPEPWLPGSRQFPHGQFNRETHFTTKLEKLKGLGRSC